MRTMPERGSGRPLAPVTERLYHTDAYARSFDARVVGRTEGGHVLYLDRSAFYPTSGGQPHDLGVLAGVTVEDVVDEGDRVAHHLREPVVADAVHGEIDWPRRFDHMQQHTGQHLLSALFADLLGHATVSVHFGAELSTLDLSCEQVAEEDLASVERRANELVLEGRPVDVTFEDAANAVGLRKATDRTGTIRVASIVGVDRSACGGTHVRSTSEVGPVLLRRRERVKRALRVEFTCGLRAIGRARRDFSVLQRAAASLSASPDDVATIVAARSEEYRALQGAHGRLQEELAEWRAAERHRKASPDASGVRRVVERLPRGSTEQVRAEALAFVALPRAVYLAVSTDPPSVLLAASEDSGVDAARTLRATLERVGGRGGGSPRLAQGALPDASTVDMVVHALAPAVPG
jgi:alanyl-tRNA synthetase